MIKYHDYSQHDDDEEPVLLKRQKVTSPFNENGSLKKNKYGNVDIRKGVPDMLTHVPSTAYGGRNIHSICRYLKIPCATALVGFDEKDGPWLPIRDGVVIPSTAVPKLMADLARRRQVERERMERKRARESTKAIPPMQADGATEKGSD